MAGWPLPMWIAHRGAGKLAPENTLAAFRLGAAHGYRAFECDVKLSADGVPFLLHDDTLDRTTDAQGVAGDRAWAELSSIDAGGWHSAAHAGEPLASLQSVAAFIRANGYALNVEIKPTTGLEHETGRQVAAACQRLWSPRSSAQDASTAMPSPLLLSSFKPESLRAAREAAPDLPRALLVDKLEDDGCDTALALGCVALVTHHRLMEAMLLQRLRRAGLRALCYTVNEAADVQRLLALGVDGIITDAVDRFAPAASALR